MKILSLSAFVALLLFAPVPGHADSAAVDKAKKAVLAKLVDPDSARFDNLRYVETPTGQFVCGTVNARNRMGGYNGPAPFVHKADAGLTHILGDNIAIYEAGKAIVEPCFPSMRIPRTATEATQLQ